MHKGFVISDIHVGAFNLERTYDEISEIFLAYIEKHDFDFLIITGDFFDHKFFLNDKESSMAYKIMRNIVDICKEKKAKLRMVYGTESHECNQYDLLSLLLGVYDDIRVIKYAKEEQLFDDMVVLYLPEEHVFDKDDTYGEFFKKENYYDYIFGHGIIREVMTDAVVHMENKESKEKKSTRKKVPIFSSSELAYCCKGQVFFGHYHINQNMNDKVFYVGSFSRWKFGEEQEKGFYEVTCGKKYKAKFIENTMAEKFVTIGYGYDNEVFESVDKMDSALTRIDKMIEDKIFDHVRFEFNIPETVENPESTISYIKNRYKFSDNIKYEIVHGYTAKKKEQQKAEIDNESKKYSFIADKSLGLEQKVSHFIAIEYNKDVPLDRTEKYLKLPLNEIISSLLGFDKDDKNDENGE